MATITDEQRDEYLRLLTSGEEITEKKAKEIIIAHAKDMSGIGQEEDSPPAMLEALDLMYDEAMRVFGGDVVRTVFSVMLYVQKKSIEIIAEAVAERVVGDVGNVIILLVPEDEDEGG